MREPKGFLGGAVHYREGRTSVKASKSPIGGCPSGSPAAPPSEVRCGSMLLKKDYEGGLLATLIQDQEQMRNHDSRNHLPGFVRFNF
jgi:hypothetical protein